MSNRLFRSSTGDKTKIALSALARYIAKEFGRALTKRILDAAGVKGHAITTPNGTIEDEYWIHEATEAIYAYRRNLNKKQKTQEETTCQKE